MFSLPYFDETDGSLSWHAVVVHYTQASSERLINAVKAEHRRRLQVVAGVESFALRDNRLGFGGARDASRLQNADVPFTGERLKDNPLETDSGIRHPVPGRLVPQCFAHDRGDSYGGHEANALHSGTDIRCQQVSEAVGKGGETKRVDGPLACQFGVRVGERRQRDGNRRQGADRTLLRVDRVMPIVAASFQQPARLCELPASAGTSTPSAQFVVDSFGHQIDAAVGTPTARPLVPEPDPPYTQTIFGRVLQIPAAESLEHATLRVGLRRQPIDKFAEDMRQFYARYGEEKKEPQ